MLNIIHHPPSLLHLDRPCRSRHHLSVNPPLSSPPPRLLSTHQVPFLLGVRAIPQPVIQFLSPPSSPGPSPLALPPFLCEFTFIFASHSSFCSSDLLIYLRLALAIPHPHPVDLTLSSPSTFSQEKKQTALVVCSLATLISCSLNFMIIH